VFISFKNIFLGIALLGVVASIMAISIRERAHGNLSVKTGIDKLLKKRDKKFWINSLPIAFTAFSATAVFTFMIPMFMKTELNFTYEIIGLLAASVALIQAATNFVSAKLKLDYWIMNYGSIIFGVIPMSIMWMPDLFVPGLFLIGIGYGFSDGVFEHLLARATKNKADVSTSISLLMAPSKITTFGASIITGVLIATYGFAYAFILAALFFFAYCISIHLILRSDRNI
jgi:predicted MFS family arabinose efflux permease